MEDYNSKKLIDNTDGKKLEESEDTDDIIDSDNSQYDVIRNRRYSYPLIKITNEEISDPVLQTRSQGLEIPLWTSSIKTTATNLSNRVKRYQNFTPERRRWSTVVPRLISRCSCASRTATSNASRLINYFTVFER